jgi:hypothetical protein
LAGEFVIAVDEIIDGFGLVQAQFSVGDGFFRDLSSLCHSHFHLFQFIENGFDYGFAAMQMKLEHFLFVVAD